MFTDNENNTNFDDCPKFQGKKFILAHNPGKKVIVAPILKQTIDYSTPKPTKYNDHIEFIYRGRYVFPPTLYGLFIFLHPDSNLPKSEPKSSPGIPGGK